MKIFHVTYFLCYLKKLEHAFATSYVCSFILLSLVPFSFDINLHVDRNLLPYIPRRL